MDNPLKGLPLWFKIGAPASLAAIGALGILVGIKSAAIALGCLICLAFEAAVWLERPPDASTDSPVARSDTTATPPH